MEGTFEGKNIQSICDWKTTWGSAGNASHSARTHRAGVLMMFLGLIPSGWLRSEGFSPEKADDPSRNLGKRWTNNRMARQSRYRELQLSCFWPFPWKKSHRVIGSEPQLITLKLNIRPTFILINNHVSIQTNDQDMFRFNLSSVNNRVPRMREAIVGFIAPAAASLMLRISSDNCKEINLRIKELLQRSAASWTSLLGLSVAQQPLTGSQAMIVSHKICTHTKKRAKKDRSTIIRNADHKSNRIKLRSRWEIQLQRCPGLGSCELRFTWWQSLWESWSCRKVVRAQVRFYSPRNHKPYISSIKPK